MIRRIFAAVSLASVVAWTGTPLVASRDKNSAIYSCGTAFGRSRLEGRLNTWSLSTLSFTPDTRSAKPVLVRYRSITRLEYGRTPPHWAESSETSPITLGCTPRWTTHHLTIFYTALTPVFQDEQTQRSEAKDQREKDKKAREERRGRTVQKEPKEQDQRRDEKGRESKDARLEEKEHFVVFEIGDGALRPTLRILEARSGRRVKYQDSVARRSAR